MALAVPQAALGEPVPAPLATVTAGATALLDGIATAEDWSAASATVAGMTAAWDAYRTGDVPTMLGIAITDALTALDAAVVANDGIGTQEAAIEVAQTSLDLQLRYQAPVDVDTVQFDLWTTRIAADVAAGDGAVVAGDVATLAWVWDRIAHTVTPKAASSIDAMLDDFRIAADGGDLGAADVILADLRGLLAGAARW